MSQVIPDTSVVVDFLRGTAPRKDPFRKLLLDNYLCLSPFVRLELLMGVNAKQKAQLSSLLDALPILSVNTELFELAEELLPIAKGKGLNVGLVDYLIVLQALSTNLPLYTRDKVMQRLAKMYKVSLY